MIPANQQMRMHGQAARDSSEWRLQMEANTTTHQESLQAIRKSSCDCRRRIRRALWGVVGGGAVALLGTLQHDQPILLTGGLAMLGAQFVIIRALRQRNLQWAQAGHHPETTRAPR